MTFLERWYEIFVIQKHVLIAGLCHKILKILSKHINAEWFFLITVIHLTYKSICCMYTIALCLLETGQSTTMYLEQLSSYIPPKLVQEDETSYSCCLTCKRKLLFMHVCCMHILRIISCYNLFCQSDLFRGFFQLKPTFSPSSLITSSNT